MIQDTVCAGVRSRRMKQILGQKHTLAAERVLTGLVDVDVVADSAAVAHVMRDAVLGLGRKRFDLGCRDLLVRHAAGCVIELW